MDYIRTDANGQLVFAQSSEFLHIKEKLAEAYRMTDEAKMADKISDIMDICNATANTHLLWFRKLLDEHFQESSLTQLTRYLLVRSKESTRKSRHSGGTAMATPMMNTFS